MKLLSNTGDERVIDELCRTLTPGATLAAASSAFSLFAFSELRPHLESLAICRLVLGADADQLGLTGTPNDRAFRNRLNIHWLARQCADWIEARVDLRAATGPLPQSVLIASQPESGAKTVIAGNCGQSYSALRAARRGSSL
jgi:hypothetical protein